MSGTKASFAAFEDKQLQSVYAPDPKRAAKSAAGSKEAFEALLKESQESPETFWEKAAKELVWINRGKTSLKAVCQISSSSWAGL